MCGFCLTFFNWVWKEVIEKLWDWFRDSIRWCTRRKCRWICLCCNKWLCWVFVFIVWVLVIVVTLVLVLLVTIICILCFPLCWIVCGLACALNKIFGRPAPGSCTACWDICTGEGSPADVGLGSGIVDGDDGMTAGGGVKPGGGGGLAGTRRSGGPRET